MSLVSMTNGDTITVSTAFQNVEFEDWLFDKLLIAALSVRGDDVVATRPERRFPALLVDDDLRRLELFTYIPQCGIIVYASNADDTEYTFVVIDYDGERYSVGEKVLVLKGDGDSPDLSELDRLRPSELLTLFGL